MSNTRTIALTAIIALAGCADGTAFESVAAAEQEAHGAGVLRVMTRNMYVGADVNPILVAPPDEVPFVVAAAFATLQSTDLAGRVAAMAAEIQDQDPDLIGLQEVSLIRIQDPGDLVFGGQQPAETVVHDFLPALLDALAAAGLGYHVAAMVENTDAEAPMITPAFGFIDVRLTDYDVILARDDVETTVVAEQNYALSLPLPNGLTVERGYVAVNARVRGHDYRVASTHLEDALLEAQLVQAQELIGFLAGSPLPVVLLGDFNSRAPAGLSYQMLLGAGYDDAWIAAGNQDPGFTCCQAGNLANPGSSLASRIDVVFTRGVPVARVKARTIAARTLSGLWASDHAGVSVKLGPF